MQYGKLTLYEGDSYPPEFYPEWLLKYAPEIRLTLMIFGQDEHEDGFWARQLHDHIAIALDDELKSSRDLDVEARRLRLQELIQWFHLQTMEIDINRHQILLRERQDRFAMLKDVYAVTQRDTQNKDQSTAGERSHPDNSPAPDTGVSVQKSKKRRTGTEAVRN
jgi:hypothetical protein